MSVQHHEEGQKASPKRHNPLLITLVLAVVLCVVMVSLLDTSTTTTNTAQASLAQAKRIQKVGSVEIREADTDRPLASGEEVYKLQCAACHATGVSGAPKFGDASEWGPRLAQGFQALLQSAIHGKGAMAPQGGGTFSDLEIARAVAYMGNAAGASFSEPEPETAP